MQKSNKMGHITRVLPRIPSNSFPESKYKLWHRLSYTPNRLRRYLSKEMTKVIPNEDKKIHLTYSVTTVMVNTFVPFIKQVDD